MIEIRRAKSITQRCERCQVLICTRNGKRRYCAPCAADVMDERQRVAVRKPSIAPGDRT